MLIDGDAIVAVGPVDELDADPRAAGAEVVDATGHAVLPGLHNCHLHSGLLRGTAESMSLWDWLKAYVDPAHKALTPEIAATASLHCYAESLLAGTTSVMDMWRFMEGSADVAAGARHPRHARALRRRRGGFDYFESIESNRRLLESHRTAADGRVRTWVGLEHLFYCTKECFAQAVALMEEFDTGIHTHSSESIWEVQESLKRCGRRPIEVFYDRGILGPRTVVAHCVWLDDREIELLAQTGTSVAHCPSLEHEARVGPGAHRRPARAGRGRRARQRRREGEQQPRPRRGDEVRVAAAEGHDARPDHGRPVGHPRPWRRSTAPRALGLDDVTGSLEPGKRADIVTVALDGLHTTPVLHGATSTSPRTSCSRRRAATSATCGSTAAALVAAGDPTTFDVARVRSRSAGRGRGAVRPHCGRASVSVEIR